MSKKLKLITLFFGVLAAKRRPESKFKSLKFRDEFNEFDLDTWNHEVTLSGGGNWEFQMYHNDRRTSYVKGGKLYIKPILTTQFYNKPNDDIKSVGEIDLTSGAPDMRCTDPSFYGCHRSLFENNIVNPISSAKITLAKSLAFKYGRVEIRAKLPKGDWLWPAIWLLPKHSYYGAWPRSGEIDLVESKGNHENYPDGGVNGMSSTLHWGTDYLNNRYHLTHRHYNLPKGQTFHDSFHIYTLEWTKDYIRTWVDDVQLLNTTFDTKLTMFEKGNFLNTQYNPWQNQGPNAPFDQKFYLIFNVAVGGTGFFPDHNSTAYPNLKKPWNNKSGQAAWDFYSGRSEWLPTWKDQYGNDEQAALVIDYVRYYNL